MSVNYTYNKLYTNNKIESNNKIRTLMRLGCLKAKSLNCIFLKVNERDGMISE